MLPEPPCPRLVPGGAPCLEDWRMSLIMGRELLVVALLIVALMAVMWILSMTRRSP